MEIRSKARFYELMRAGCLGNTLRNWKTKEEALASGCSLFGIREVGAAGGGRHYIVPAKELGHHTFALHRCGVSFIIDEAAPDTDVTLQGEVCRTERGWEGLLGIRTGHRMRESIARGLLRPYRGLAVKLLLDQFLDPSSRDDIDAIFDLYPDSAVELASYPYKLGKLPCRNTVIWEVRNY